MGPLVAGIGAVLLLVSLFLDWYEDLTALTVFEFVDIVLVVCALLIVVQLAGGMGLDRATGPPGLAADFAVRIRRGTDPGTTCPAVAGGNGPDRDIGIWLRWRVRS